MRGGYLNLIETWGSDERIIESARMSTNKGFQGWGEDGKPGDEKLLKYLYEHKHHTPFEMCGMTIEVQAPIFVFREWQRHRTQSYNELSARYTEIPEMYYVPSLERLLSGGQSKTNKQGSGEALSEEAAKTCQMMIDLQSENAFRCYHNMISFGLSRELARLVLPVNTYSRMRASANLRNWLSFLTLRQDPSAQWEIRNYANAVAELVEQHFPRTYSLYIGKDA